MTFLLAFFLSVLSYFLLQSYHVQNTAVAFGMGLHFVIAAVVFTGTIVVFRRN